MKRNYLLALSCIAVFTTSLLLMSNDDGPRVGSSGSPLENGQNCTQCHDGTVNSGSGSLTISGPEEYEPGEVYTIDVEVSDASSSKFGFQAIAVDASNMASGSFTTSPGLETQSDEGNTYIQQSSSSTTGSFSFDWTAPSNDVGTITFYAAGNAADGDRRDDGDNIYTNTLEINAAAATGLENTTRNELSVFPNPSDGNFKLDIGSLRIDDLQIFSLSGQLMHHESSIVSDVVINDLPVGIYLLKANTSTGTITQKLVVR